MNEEDRQTEAALQIDERHDHQSYGQYAAPDGRDAKPKIISHPHGITGEHGARYAGGCMVIYVLPPRLILDEQV
jgi:hypothetical protein